MRYYTLNMFAVVGLLVTGMMDQLYAQCNSELSYSIADTGYEIDCVVGARMIVRNDGPGNWDFDISPPAAVLIMAPNRIDYVLRDDVTYTVTSTKTTDPTCFESFVVTAPSFAFTYTINVTDASDCNAADGSITIVCDPPETGSTYDYYLDGVLQFTNTFSSMPPGDYTVGVLRRLASATCNQDIPVTVDAPFSATANGFAPSECGSGDGIITVTPPNCSNINSFEYALAGQFDFKTTPTFFAIAPGSYTVYVRESPYTGGFVDTISVSVPPPLGGFAVTYSLSNTVNQNECNVPYNLSVNAPYASSFTYTLSGEGTNSTGDFTGLVPGETYSLTVTDDLSSCQGTTAVYVPRVEKPDGSSDTEFDLTLASDCDGASDGVIEFTFPLTTSEYNVAYDIFVGTPDESNPVFSGLSPTRHNFFVTTTTLDGMLLCDELVSIDLFAEGGAATASIEYPNGCGGAANITLDAPDPTASSTSYRLLPDGSYSSNPTFNNLSPGVYDFEVITIGPAPNFPYCQYFTTVDLTISPTVDITGVNFTTPVYCGGDDGTITINVDEPNGTTYSINGIDYQSSSVFTALAAGTYPVYARSSAGCVTQFATDITLSDGTNQPPLNLFNTESPSQCGATDGLIFITTSSGQGIPNYEYSVGSSAGPIRPYTQSTTQSVGTSEDYRYVYRRPVGATNDDCRIRTRIGFIDPGPAIQIVEVTSGTYGPADCLSSNGRIEVAPAPASPTATVYAYYLYDANDFSIEYGPSSSGVFEGLPVGDYRAVLFSAGAGDECPSNELSIALTAPPFPVRATADPLICENSTTSIEILAPIGPEYAYEIIGLGGGEQTSSVFDNISAGTYEIIVTTTESSCTGSATVTVLPGEPLDFPSNTVVVTDATNCGTNNGSIAFNLPNTPGVIYETRINPQAAYQVENLYSNLSPGTYYPSVKVQDEECYWAPSGGPVTLSFDADPLSLSVVSATNAASCLDNTGTVTLAATGGTGNYVYGVFRNGWQEQTSPTFTDLPTNLISFRVRDAVSPNCGVDALTYQVGNDGDLAFDLTIQQPVCGNTTGSITVNYPLADAVLYEYLLELYNNAGFYRALYEGDGYTFSDVPSGTYTLAFSGDGEETRCYETTTVTINNPIPPVGDIEYTIVEEADCDGGATIEVTSPLDPGNYTYELVGITSPQLSNTFVDVPPGIYNLIVTQIATRCQEITSVKV
ncbi:MAG: hypothetical protein AAF828_04310, partial [Bacteroidota bacterium]